MKKLYEQSPEMQLSGKCQLRHVKCTHHKGYLMEDLSMIKSGFYEISFCKSGDFLFRIGQKRHFITNGDILVIPPDIPHYFTSSDLVANYYDFITVWLEKSYISNLKSQLPALKESVFNIDTPHLLHTTNKLCNFEEEFETFYREYASYGELSETYACGASTCLLVKVINYALKYSNEFIEIDQSDRPLSGSAFSERNRCGGSGAYFPHEQEQSEQIFSETTEYDLSSVYFKETAGTCGLADPAGCSA